MPPLPVKLQDKGAVALIEDLTVSQGGCAWGTKVYRSEKQYLVLAASIYAVSQICLAQEQGAAAAILILNDWRPHAFRATGEVPRLLLLSFSQAIQTLQAITIASW